MHDTTAPPDAGGQVAMVLVALAASLALLVLNQGLFPWRDHPGALAGAYVVVLSAAPAAALLLARAGDAWAWGCATGIALVWGGLGVWAGVTGLAQEPVGTLPDLGPNVCGVLGVTLFITLAFLAAARTRPRLAYPALFAAAWDHALALAVAAVFTGAAWLVLWLWAGLFKVIGIGLFADVFFSARFAHPATGLFVGLGLVLGRGDSGVVRALLRICLTAGTVLLPLIALVGLSFAIALPFTGLQGLWDTRRAAALLITLVLGTAALTNAVFQDGTRAAPPYPRSLRVLVSAALAVLPVFAVLAAWALALRVHQYGWTLDRAYGALFVLVAGAYAFGYAAALVVRRPAWLGLVAPVNVATAALLVMALLASIAPGTDFRAVAARAQLARALADPTHADVDYLRWQLGEPGVQALRRLKDAPALAAHADVLTDIRTALARKQRWGGDANDAALSADQFAVVPTGTALPAGLLTALEKAGHHQAMQCSPRRCALLAVDLDGAAGSEWVLLAAQPVYAQPVVLGRAGDTWQAVGQIAEYGWPDAAGFQTLMEALRAGNTATVPPRFQDLTVGDRRYTVQPTDP